MARFKVSPFFSHSQVFLDKISGLISNYTKSIYYISLLPEHSLLPGSNNFFDQKAKSPFGHPFAQF